MRHAVLPTAVCLLLIVVTVTAETPAVVVVDYKVEPEILMPGDMGTITVTIKNAAQVTETESTVTTSIRTTVTRTVTSSMCVRIESVRLRSRNIVATREDAREPEYLNVGALGPGETLTLSFTVKAECGDGTYFPEVCIDVDGGQTVRFPIPVKVDSSGVKILEKDVPSEISPTGSEHLTLVVANNRANVVSAVSVRASGEDLEFSPEEVFIGNLQPYETKEIVFTVTPKSKGAKEVTFHLSYKNGDNMHHGSLKTSILVRSREDVRIILVRAPRYVPQGETASIELEVANGMPKGIKAVSVVPASELRIMPSEYFIGDMEADDVFSASFDVDTSDLSPGTYEIPFKLFFKDDESGRFYEASLNVSFDVIEASKESNYLFVLLPALFIAVVLSTLLFRRRRRGGR